MEKLIYQQGDVLLFESEIPNNAKSVKAEARGVVLARGELTGHAHVMAPESVQIFESNGVLYLRVLEATPLVHEEHGSQLIKPKEYRVSRVKEIDPFEKSIQEVQD